MTAPLDIPAIRARAEAAIEPKPSNAGPFEKGWLKTELYFTQARIDFETTVKPEIVLAMCDRIAELEGESKLKRYALEQIERLCWTERNTINPDNWPKEVEKLNKLILRIRGVAASATPGGPA